MVFEGQGGFGQVGQISVFEGQGGFWRGEERIRNQSTTGSATKARRISNQDPQPRSSNQSTTGSATKDRQPKPSGSATKAQQPRPGAQRISNQGSATKAHWISNQELQQPKPPRIINQERGLEGIRSQGSMGDGSELTPKLPRRRRHCVVGGWPIPSPEIWDPSWP